MANDEPAAISVLMPVYNAERYVAQAVEEQILAQTFADFEFLIIDEARKTVPCDPREIRPGTPGSGSSAA